MKKVIFLSGGLDSSVCLASALKEGHSVLPLFFQYGQRHIKEREACLAIIKHYHLLERLTQIKIDLSFLPQRGLLGNESLYEESSNSTSIAYLPFRNGIFLAYGIAYALTKKANSIIIGINATDTAGFPDCRPDFISQFEKAVMTGIQKNRSITIEAPLQNLTKSEIIKRGLELNIPFNLTWTCYEGGEIPCTLCLACREREKGFQTVGIKDPLIKSSKK